MANGDNGTEPKPLPVFHPDAPHKKKKSRVKTPAFGIGALMGVAAVALMVYGYEREGTLLLALSGVSMGSPFMRKR